MSFLENGVWMTFRIQEKLVNSLWEEQKLPWKSENNMKSNLTLSPPLFWNNCRFINSWKTYCREMLCTLYPVSLVITSCKTIIQYHKQDMCIYAVKIQNIFLITRIPHVALLYVYSLLSYLILSFKNVI